MKDGKGAWKGEWGLDWRSLRKLILENNFSFSLKPFHFLSSPTCWKKNRPFHSYFPLQSSISYFFCSMK